MSRKHVLIGGRRAAILHGDQFDTGGELELFRDQMGGGGDAGRGVPQSARLGFGQRNELLHRRCRHGRVDHQQVRPGGQEHHRGKILSRIVGQLGVEMLQHGVGAVEAEIDGVAVGRRFRDVVRGEHAVGAGAVLDHDDLAGALLHLGGEGATDDVGHAAGRGRHDDANRTVGIILAVRRGLRWRKRRDCGQR